MKVPISWLKDYVEFDLDPKALASLLTFSGTEVEGITTLGGDFAGVVVGEVLAVERHPNADRLTVCQVSTGQATLTVVCGAPNVAAGIKVPLATIGCVLPNGLKIKKAKVRGIESSGMLCAADELGLSDDHSGLMILPDEARTGAPFSEIAGPPETVLELEVTPNRPDCLSMIGIAREVAALLGKSLKVPAPVLREGSDAVESQAKVVVEDGEGCPRYTARVVSGVTVAPSPQWMQRRLAAAGIRPISNVVDVTNYVMLECGQPLHAFDRDLLEDRTIVVRRVKAGEAMKTLDGMAREIKPEMLVIADAARPVAVAGVMGGAGSEIRPQTHTVLLESACFHPSDVRRTSKRLGLSTDSSYRFERGVDIEGVEWASRRAVQLIGELAGGQVARGVIDVYPGVRTRTRIPLRFSRVRELLGIDLSESVVVSLFRGLGLVVSGSDAAGCVVEIPAYRVDLAQEADLIEEVARIHGLDKIPSPSPAARLVPGADDQAIRSLLALRGNLVGLGLAEILNYSFLSERLLDQVGFAPVGSRVVLPNPISADHAVLRDSLIPQMIDTLGRNRSRQCAAAALFELGRVFFKNAAGATAEEERLCIGLMGSVGRFGMDREQPVKDETMFLWMKGVLESLCRAQHVAEVGTSGLRFLALELKTLLNPAFEEGAGVEIWIEGVRVGAMGLVRSGLREEWRLNDPVAVMEVKVGALLPRALRVPAARPIGTFPGVERDVAMVVPDALSHAAVVEMVAKSAPCELADIRLFDVYRGESVGKGRKSVAYRLTYRSMEKTLTDEEVNGFHDRIKDALRREGGAEIREG